MTCKTDDPQLKHVTLAVQTLLPGRMKYPIPIGCNRPGFLGTQARFGSQFLPVKTRDPLISIVCDGSCMELFVILMSWQE